MGNDKDQIKRKTPHDVKAEGLQIKREMANTVGERKMMGQKGRKKRD